VTESSSPIHFPSKFPSVTSSSRLTPTSAGNAQGNCFGPCIEGSVSLDLDLSNNLHQLDLTTQQENVGVLLVPDSVAPGGNIGVSFVSNIQNPGSNLGNTIIDVTLQDQFDQLVTQLTDDIVICLEQEGDIDDNACLSFFNERTNKWECEDNCLERNGNQFCGRTDHLTSFALLLDGSGGGSSGCSSSSIDYLITWLSCGAIVLAIIIVAVAVLANETRFQYFHWRQRQTLVEIRTLDKSRHSVGFAE